MKAQAAVMMAVGGPDVLHLQEIEVAWPGPSDRVLVRMKAAGVNPADTFFRALGAYLESDGPTVLGHDGAGIVEAVGADVTEFAVGDRVCFCNGGIGGDPGTYAQYAVVPDYQLAHIPDDVSLYEPSFVKAVFWDGGSWVILALRAWCVERVQR